MLPAAVAAADAYWHALQDGVHDSDVGQEEVVAKARM
jgi:hypothetical protein